ncbi:myosin-IIIb-like isoform X2 [Dendronephthya gigantea]|nr:myosin-IIIb-like isoform X2 [Dendronephthya gigantea]
MHRDIKGANILLTSNASVKLVDFGVSAQLSNSEARRHSSVGTPYWMSPEVIACDQQFDYTYDARCDVWSLGITAIELADGVPPFAEEHPMRALFKIPRSPPPTVKNPAKCSATFNDFVSKCVIKDFERRPRVPEVLLHKFVKWVPQKKRELQQTLKNLMSTHYGAQEGVDCENSWHRSPIGAHRNRWRDRKMLGVDDLASLENLTEETILTHVMERYLGDQIYTYIGDILIAVNPFKSLPIYDQQNVLKFLNVNKQAAPPHIYAVAASAHRSMVINQHQQCCLISGESGAGKTVSSNFLVQQLAELGKSGNRMLENRILQVNPLMEALGNAQTGINDNSSRFGKYLELQFTSNGNIIGARLAEYLLEKSRVVSQSEEERNFHVFYYFLAGLWRDGTLGDYSLKVKGKYKYLQSGKKSLEEAVFTTENQKRYVEFKKALKIIGFTAEEMSTLFSIIAAIIHIGDIDFIEDNSDRHMTANSKVSNYQQLEIIASLLKVSANDLCYALITSSNVTRGETISRKNTVQQSQDCRDAMAKAMYNVLFSWIVDRINQLLAPEDGLQSKEFKIGILDIFGFENFYHNSFEQLFINIANEQIQHYFNQYIFTMEINEYQKEGIPTSKITMKDNKHMVDLFLQRPMGLLALLDEECGFPKANDKTLIDKFNSNIQSDCFTRSRDVKPSFTIKHYAGEVFYDATGFLEKNRDTMSPDIVHVLRTSENMLLRTSFSQGAMLRNDYQGRKPLTSPYRGGKMNGQERKESMIIVSMPAGKSTNSVSRRQQTLSMNFRGSLEDLLYRLNKAEPHFVRCIKPNDKKMADLFDQERVMTQLKYTGVLETTRLRKEGYSERITFGEFVRRYQLVLFHLNENVRADALSCKAILRAAGLDHWLVGKTKIFLKYYHVEKLGTILEKYRHSVILVQRAVRAWLQKRRFKRVRDKRNESAIVLQKVYRGRLVRKKYGNMLNKRTRKAIVIQSAVRGWLAVRRYKRLKVKREKSAIKLQAVFRGYRVKMFFRKELEMRRRMIREQHEAAAKKITAVARGFQGRKEYGRLLEKSSQMETKMIYFLQQVSHLCNEFYGVQRKLNKPVPKKDRYTEEMGLTIPMSLFEQNKGVGKPRETFPKRLNGESVAGIELLERGNETKPLKVNPIAATNQTKSVKPKRKTPLSPKKYSAKIDESGYKINPILLEAEVETETEIRKRRAGSFLIDSNPLGLNYDNTVRDKEPRREDVVIINNRNGQDRARKTSRNQSSNVVVREPSQAGYVRRKPSESGRVTQNGELHEVEDVSDLRARLRRTGQIEEGSGLHRIELARQHSQRIIDVQ